MGLRSEPVYAARTVRAEYRDRIFLQVLRFTSAAERRAFLDQGCNGDAALREEIDALLRALEQTGSVLSEASMPRL